MYWGSVKFFKHIILLIILGILSTTVSVAIYWCVQYQTVEQTQQTLNSQLAQAQTEQKEFEDALQELHAGSSERFIALCEKNNLSVDDVMRILTSQDAQATDAFSEVTSPYDDEVVAGGASEGTVITTVSPTAGASATDSPYAAIQPTLRTTPPQKNTFTPKSVYLTFDGGMNQNVGKILEILKKNNVKATFFTCPAEDGSDAALLKQIVTEGHTLGIRLSTNYKVTYASVEDFLNAFASASARIEQATGIKPNIFRFPGGSLNDYNQAISKDLISEMLSRGYRYFDWNVDSGETKNQNNTEHKMFQNTVNAVNYCDRAMVLMYDELNSTATVQALDRIITQLQDDGYTFYNLTNEVQPMVFKAKQD